MGVLCSKFLGINVGITTGKYGGKNYSAAIMTCTDCTGTKYTQECYANWVNSVEKTKAVSVADCLYKMHDIEYTMATTTCEVKNADKKLISSIRSNSVHMNWCEYILTRFVIVFFSILILLNWQVYKPDADELIYKQRYRTRLLNIHKNAEIELKSFY